MNREYALLLKQLTEGLKNKLQVRKYWETDIKNQPIDILKATEETNKNYQDS